jgi:hypothetical protein
MSKISAKLKNMKVDQQQGDSAAANNQAGRRPGKVNQQLQSCGRGMQAWAGLIFDNHARQHKLAVVAIDQLTTAPTRQVISTGVS